MKVLGYISVMNHRPNLRTSAYD